MEWKHFDGSGSPQTAGVRKRSTRSVGHIETVWAYRLVTARPCIGFRRPPIKGAPHAMNALGELYCGYLDHTPDYVAALAWFTKAAALGSAQAMLNIGFLYASGRGVDRSEIEALKWFDLAVREATGRSTPSGISRQIRNGRTPDTSRSSSCVHKRNELAGNAPGGALGFGSLEMANEVIE